MKLDNSGRSCFIECPRKFYWTYFRNIVPSKGSIALHYGSSVHKGLEVFYKLIKLGTPKQESMNAGIVAAQHFLLNPDTGQTFSYDWRNEITLQKQLTRYLNEVHIHENIEVVDTELEFSIPVTDWLEFTGKIDLVLKMQGQIWNLDHKTTSMSATLEAQRLNRSPQIMGYNFAAECLFEKVGGALVNFLQASARKNKNGDYGEVSMDFHRAPILYSKEDITEWLSSFIYIANLIRLSISGQIGDKMLMWPCYLDRCYGMYGTCAYLPLCLQQTDLESVGTEGYIANNWDKVNLTQKSTNQNPLKINGCNSQEVQ